MLTVRWCWNDSDWEKACSIENTLSLPHYFSFREADSDSEPSHSDISSDSLSNSDEDRVRSEEEEVSGGASGAEGEA
ncbi:uncharacterized protein DS421_19g646980 [Arachis hypogaea]|uniref:Uncharacterized protein n=1 Tax=Arachis hypogaea TaxID=3818 RepID=A0A6B9V5G8_ARAHY|nr:uncharacterized protein DS421_19g646980 [Arachis hypogaea]